MAPLPVIPEVFRCAFEWTASGQHAVNVIHIGTQASGKTPLQVWTALDANIPVGLFTLSSTAASVTAVAITKLDGFTSTVTFPTGSPAKWSGGLAGDFIPDAAVMIKLATGFRGRSFRGRIFLPFTAEGAQANGVITSGSVTGLTASWQAFQAALQADATTPCSISVASYLLSSAAIATNISAETALGTQRRRQGRNR